ADTLMAKNFLDQVNAYFSNPKVVAASGNLRVLNRDTNFLTKLQSYEYLIAFDIGRRLQALFRTLLIVPGAAQVIRRFALESMGAYDIVVGEDFDMTLKVHKVRGRVIFMPEAYTWTEVPTTWRSWLRQRIRWHKSQIRVLIKHRDFFFRRIYGLPGMLGAPDMVLMDMVMLLVRPAWFIYFLTVFHWLAMLPALFLFYIVTEVHTLLGALSVTRWPKEDLKHSYLFPI
ncbi:glycosyltransferase family 2 protein, partial [Candidatus Bathyarchaeota archaeon]|nr:glycosyltransferase family 2 protein [Candidatus Bathyarchaeota archaeon]